MPRYIIFNLSSAAPERLRIIDEDSDGGILAEADEDWITYMPRTYLDGHKHVFVR